MTKYAPSRYPQSIGETAGQLSDEERDKLQEIHELINLMVRELPVMAQVTARPYSVPPGMTAIPVVPYTYSMYQLPWYRERT